MHAHSHPLTHTHTHTHTPNISHWFAHTHTHTHLEFRIRIANYEEEEPEEIHEFCMKVRKTVVETLKSVLDLHEHTRKTKFQLGFYCPGSFKAGGQPHFCGCLPRQNYTDPKSFVCSKSPRCRYQCRIPHEFTIWFEYWKVCCTFSCFLCC